MNLTIGLKAALMVAAACVLAGCGQVRWVAITRASATDQASTSLGVTIDGCSGGFEIPNPRVIESDTQVHVLIDLKLDYGNMKACLSGTIVHLAHPIGTRTVIDDRAATTSFRLPSRRSRIHDSATEDATMSMPVVRNGSKSDHRWVVAAARSTLAANTKYTANDRSTFVKAAC